MNCIKCGNKNEEGSKSCVSCGSEINDSKKGDSTVVEKKNKKSSKSWLLWWKVNEEELKQQVDNYNTLSIFKSARGQSTLYLLLSALLTFSAIIFGYGADSSAYVDIVLFLILAFFIYRGHLWAIVGAMIIWTFEKISLIFILSGAVVQFMWWIVYMRAFWLAFKVEKERKKIKIATP